MKKINKTTTTTTTLKYVYGDPQKLKLEYCGPTYTAKRTKIRRNINKEKKVLNQ